MWPRGRAQARPETFGADPANLLFEGVGLTAPVRDRTFRLARAVLTRGGEVERHYHRQAGEAYILLNGAATRIVDGLAIPAAAGEVILIEPGETTTQGHEEDGRELKAVAIWNMTTGAGANAVSSWLRRAAIYCVGEARGRT